MSDPATATWVGQPVWQGVAECQTKQRQCRLVWVDEESVMPQPVLQTAGE